jgi:hypothetical protein
LSFEEKISHVPSQSGALFFPLSISILTILTLPVLSSVISVLEVVKEDARLVTMLEREFASRLGLPKDAIAPYCLASSTMSFKQLKSSDSSAIPIQAIERRLPKRLANFPNLCSIKGRST